jgi:hypothetical protein
VQLWETSTWRRLPPLTGFTAQVHRLAFALDGKSLAACDHGGTIWLWDMVDRRPVATRRGHSTTIESVAFSPDGRRLATAGYENTIKLWDVALLQEVATLAGHDGYVGTVAFSPDGNTLASASADATVRLWQAPPLAQAPRKPREAPGVSSLVEVIHLFGLVTDAKARATLTTSDHTERVDVTATGENDSTVQLVQVFDDLQEGAAYTIRFRAKADTSRRIQLYGQVGRPDWHPIGLDQRFELSDKWQNYEFPFQAKDLAALNKIALLVGQQTGTVWIADFTLTKLADADPTDPEIQKRLRRHKKSLAAERGAGEELPLLATVVADDPKDTLLSLRLAALQAWFGQEKELAATRQRIRAHARATGESTTAERAAKACSLVPSTSKAELDSALALARRGVELDAGGKIREWALLALGMAEYRIGHDAAAREALEAATEAAPNNPLVKSTAAFYRAMSLSRQGKQDGARRLALAAAAEMKPLPKDARNPLADGADHEDLILWLAYKEAKAMIGFDEAQPSGGPSGGPKENK